VSAETPTPKPAAAKPSTRATVAGGIVHVAKALDGCGCTVLLLVVLLFLNTNNVIAIIRALRGQQ
jgi:hypothetical protein